LDLKPGERLRSTTSSTEVVVVRGSGERDVRCGGQPMTPDMNLRFETLPVEPGFEVGPQLGKRYEDLEQGVEVLCTTAGGGTLCLGTTPLSIKSSKSLPASD
jgi:hypothetical protein